MIRVLGALPTIPPVNPGVKFGYLTAFFWAQDLLPYPPGTGPGDVMLGFLPWFCQSGFYGDFFNKWDNPSQFAALDGEVLSRFLDGTEGTIPQNGIAALGMMGAEGARPDTDLITGLSLRGADRSGGPVFKVQNLPTITPDGTGQYLYTAVTPSFVVAQPSMVVCAQYVRAIDWNSGDPDYITTKATLEWYGAPPLDLVTESMCSGPMWKAGWRVSVRSYAAGETVPDIVGVARSNSSEGFGGGPTAGACWQLTAVFAQGVDIVSVARSGGTLTLAGDRPPSASVTVSALGHSDWSVTYPTAYTWACTATGYAGGSSTIIATDGTNTATRVYPDDDLPPVVDMSVSEDGGGRLVSLAASRPSRIFYTLDGSAPSDASRTTRTYTVGFISTDVDVTTSAIFNYEPISVPAGATLRAVGLDDRGAVSAEVILPPLGTWLTASAGALLLVAGVPTLTQAAPQVLAASAGALALTPGMPWLAQARRLSASPASLSLSPGLPTLSQHALSLFKAPDGTALPFKVWSGSQWVEVPVRLWNGSQFN